MSQTFFLYPENQYHSMTLNKRHYKHLSMQLDSRKKIKCRYRGGGSSFRANLEAPAWVPPGERLMRIRPCASPARSVRTGVRLIEAGYGVGGAQPRVLWSGGPTLRPRGSQVPRKPSRRLGYHGFRGSRGLTWELPPARCGWWGRGGPGGGEKGPRWEREEPEMLPALPGPRSLSYRRRTEQLRAGPARPPTPIAPHSQPVALPAPSAPGGRPGGPRPVRGGGEGGAQAPAARKAE